MPQFCDIPIELVFSILCLLGQTDLSSFSRTCKQFHQVATPWLWKSYRNYNRQPFNYFLRVILSNPKLAEHVEEFHTSNVSEDDPHDISEEDIQLF